MTSFEQLLLSEMSKLRDGQAEHGVLLGRIDERLQDVEARLPAAPVPRKSESAPLSKATKAAIGAAGLLLGGAVAGLLQAWVQ